MSNDVSTVGARDGQTGREAMGGVRGAPVRHNEHQPQGARGNEQLWESYRLALGHRGPQGPAHGTVSGLRPSGDANILDGIGIT